MFSPRANFVGHSTILRVQGVLTDAELNLVKEIANRAMIAGWENAIFMATRQSGISQIQVRDLLNRAVDFNNSADPHSRIPELANWEKERMGRSERASNTKSGNLHKLSPGLRAYMEAKQAGN